MNFLIRKKSNCALFSNHQGGVIMSQYHSDVVIHINETLGDEARDHLERDIRKEKGIREANVSHHARHLMIVNYDPEDISALNILHRVEYQGLHAQLVGW
jgi:hypothetical protein